MSGSSSGKVRIGISGWNYPGWRKKFYPEGLRQRDELKFASGKFSSLEVNGTFYSLKKPADFRRWRDVSPPGFQFAVKGSRFITHMKKLRDIDAALANFFASGVLALGDRQGPFLWQFPRQMTYWPERFEDFFRALPRSADAASGIAARHDHRISGKERVLITPEQPNRRFRHAVEIRHDSFLCTEFIAQLRKHRIGLVIADTGPVFPFAEDITADFVYVRLHGSEELYASGYTDDALGDWAKRIAAWRRGDQHESARTVTADHPPRASREVFVYFDNDAKTHAPFDAMKLAKLVDDGD